MQVTIIGGGSYQWSPKLIADLLSLPSMAGVHLVLEDIDAGPLEKMESIARMADDKLGAKSTVSTTTDQRRALEGADFVVVTISTGGFTSMAVDIDVPARHGIHQSVGDSVGPGGISRALRNIPVLAGIGRDMEDQCPDAWMLNITNPMTTLTRTVCRETRIKTVGLCHEVGGFCMDLAIAFRKPHTVVRPVIRGSTTFPSSPRSTSMARTDSGCWPRWSTSSAVSRHSPRHRTKRKRSRSRSSTSGVVTCSS